ncbi:MAG TPA: DedA family protein [Myxococcaceae bacterium]|nr:DedA family protein [Myxococcaceae bacterium]
MQQFLQDLLGGASGIWAYGAVFSVLVACGLGVPLPEDISLILGGFLAHRGAVNLQWMMAVGFTGILLGDSLIYLAGRRVGCKVARGGGFWSRVVTAEKRAKVEALFALHGQKIVMIARFLPGVRAVTYFTAGSARMSFWRFIFWDGVAALASAPLFVYLGFRFGDELETLVGRVKEGQLVVVGALALAAAAYGLYRWRKNAAQRRKSHEAQNRLPPEGDLLSTDLGNTAGSTETRQGRFLRAST